MSIFETLGSFWIVGILLNVVLGTLAIWWVIRQMKSPATRDTQERTGMADDE